MRGSGAMADQIARLFRLFARKHALDRNLDPCDCTRFRRPLPERGQLRFF
jgi:hypothetical protein